jgi:hypothetical protein
MPDPDYRAAHGTVPYQPWQHRSLVATVRESQTAEAGIAGREQTKRRPTKISPSARDHFDSYVPDGPGRQTETTTTGDAVHRMHISRVYGPIGRLILWLVAEIS